MLVLQFMSVRTPVDSSEMAEIASDKAFSSGEVNGSDGETTTSIQEKQAAMLKHLADLNNARLQQSQSRKTETLSAPVFESVDLFLKRFSETKQKIHKRLDDFHKETSTQDKSLLKSGLETLALDINELEKLVAVNSYFLPSYEVRSAQNAIAELKERLDSLNSQLLPKKKFTFKNRVTKTNSENTQKPENTVSKKNDNHIVTQSGRDNYCAPGFRNKEGLVLVKDLDSSKDGDFALSDLVRCRIYLRGRLRALYIHRLKGCQVFAGPVMGSVLIESVENCVFMLASHQIRIHQTTNTDFYLRVRSRPIVEYTSRVRFAPYALFYRGIEEELQQSDLMDETGMWANVDDFRWLRAVPSPNWSVLPEDDRLPLVDISDLKVEEDTVSCEHLQSD